MKKNLLLLMLFVGIQVLNAQSLSPANVEAYVKYQYGKSWKDIALYFVEKDVLDKDNALNFEKTFSVPGKSKNELFVDLNYWFWSAMLGAALDADYDKRPPYKVDETWTLNNCFPFAKKDATKKISSKAYVMAHGYGDMLLSNIEAQFAVTQKENPQNGTAIEMVVHRGRTPWLRRTPLRRLTQPWLTGQNG